MAAAEAISELLSLAPAARELDNPDRFVDFFQRETAHLSPEQRATTERLVNEMVDAAHQHETDEAANEVHEAADDDTPTGLFDTDPDNTESVRFPETPAPPDTEVVSRTDPTESDAAVAETMNEISRYFFLDQHSPARLPLLYRAVVIMGVAALERHIGHLYEAFHVAHPESVSKTAQLTLAELTTFGTIADAVSEVIDRQKDDFLWQSFDDWGKWFDERLSVKFSACCVHEGNLREGLARRNVMVHNDGRVSRQYRREVGAEAPPVGTRLELDEPYVLRLLDDVLVFGVLLGLVTWRKIGGKKDHRPFHYLADLQMPLMISGRWSAVEALSRQGIKLGIAQSESDRSVLQVNEWLAAKRLKDAATIKQAVEAWDTSATMNVFRLAKAALLDDLPTLRELVRATVAAKELSMLDIHKWPLLAEYRADGAYAELIAATEPWRAGG